MNLNKIKFIGKDIVRPECVIIDKRGVLHVSDFRGGITRIYSNKKSKLTLPKNKFKIKPNGLTIVSNNSWLVTHLDEREGGVYKLSFDGQIEPFLLEIENKPLPPTNYVHFDFLGRIWITVSTRKIPRINSHNANCDDGFIILVENGKAKIVADKLCFANECYFNPFDKKIYVNETFGKRITTFDVGKEGMLKNRQIFFKFDFGEFPDGLNFDQEGGLWVTSIVSNKLIRIMPNGHKQIILEDNNFEFIKFIEERVKNLSLTKKDMSNLKSKKLKNISSIAFGGKDMKRIYLGCLQDDKIPFFENNIRGLKPAFWSNCD